MLGLYTHMENVSKSLDFWKNRRINYIEHGSDYSVHWTEK